MENEKKSSASVFLALIIGIVIGVACFFVYKTFIVQEDIVPAEEVTPVEETQPVETEEPVEVSFLESLKTSILDTFEVEEAPVEIILEEEPMMAEEVYFGEGEMMMEEDLPIIEDEPMMMESEEMLETLLDETPEPEVMQEPSELEELIEEPMMELKLPSTGPDPSMM